MNQHIEAIELIEFIGSRKFMIKMEEVLLSLGCYRSVLNFDRDKFGTDFLQIILLNVTKHKILDAQLFPNQFYYCPTAYDYSVTQIFPNCKTISEGDIKEELKNKIGSNIKDVVSNKIYNTKTILNTI
jgi:hypothetical protein